MCYYVVGYRMCTLFLYITVKAPMNILVFTRAQVTMCSVNAVAYSDKPTEN